MSASSASSVQGMRRRALLWAAPVAFAIAAFGMVGGGRAKEYLRALWFLNADRPATSGPFAVGVREIELEIESWGRTTVLVWYPTTAARPGLLQRAVARLMRPTSAYAIPDAPWPESPGRFPLIIHFPSWFATRVESTFTPAELGSQGIVVAAVDDIVHLQRLATQEGQAQAAGLDAASPEAFAVSRDLARQRAPLEARFGRAVIDALLVQPDVGPHLDAARIGASGFSFGGAAAVELSLLDPRVRAVVNFDGLILGAAETAGVNRPYVYFSSNITPPTAEELNQPDLARRYDRMLDGEVLAFQQRQAERPDNATVFIPGIEHTDFTDRLLMPAFRDGLRPRQLDRVGTWFKMNERLLAFFVRFLGGAGTTYRGEHG